MISRDSNLKRYCSEPLENIENYDKAVADTEHKWDCHHRAEVLPCGRYTQAQLQKHGLYWHRPASELIFLRQDVHMSIHRKGKPLSEETRRKLSEAHTPTKIAVEMTRLADGFTRVFPSQHEAGRWLCENGFPRAKYQNISMCCRGIRASAYGAKWRVCDGRNRAD